MSRIHPCRVLGFFLPMLAAALEPGYVDPSQCAKCHAEAAAAYAKSGKARSIRANPTAVPGRFFHLPSKREYQIEQRGSESWLKRSQNTSDSRPINIVEKKIDFAIGSGAHAESYASRNRKGKLIQLPATWYSENVGVWVMAPGYDRAIHPDFQAEITPECLFCHSAYPAQWNAGQPAAIDCQRCHGPGEQHIATPTESNIVNPARLSPDRQLEVCLQCHLQTASRGIPDSIRRFERTAFSYRPGEKLEDFTLFFDHAQGRQDKFELNHSAYRLFQSKCQPLACSNCHSAHSAKAPVYREVCQGCHTSQHAYQTTDCTGCHMPKRRAEDAVHIVVTDHRIQKLLPPGNLAAERKESDVPYVGPLKPYGLSEPDPLYLAIAQVRNFNNLNEGINQLGALINSKKPAHGDYYLQLADALHNTKDYKEADYWYSQALKRSASNPAYLSKQAINLVLFGKAKDAIQLLKKSGDLLNLGIAYRALEKHKEAQAAFEQLTVQEPDSAAAWWGLATTLEKRGLAEEAQKAYREAIRLHPELINLTNLRQK